MSGSNEIRQGDIVIVNLDPTIGHEQAKTRPCVVLQCDMLNTFTGTTIIAPITSTAFPKNYPNIVTISSKTANLDKKSSVKLEQIKCIDKSRVKKKAGFVSEEEMSLLKIGLKQVFRIF